MQFTTIWNTCNIVKHFEKLTSYKVNSLVKQDKRVSIYKTRALIRKSLIKNMEPKFVFKHC